MKTQFTALISRAWFRIYKRQKALCFINIFSRGKEPWGTLSVPRLEKGSLRSAAVPRVTWPPTSNRLSPLPRKPFSVRNVWNLYNKLVWLILFSILLKHNEERKKKVLRSLHNIVHIEKNTLFDNYKKYKKIDFNNIWKRRNRDI